MVAWIGLGVPPPVGHLRWARVANSGDGRSGLAGMPADGNLIGPDISPCPRGA